MALWSIWDHASHLIFLHKLRRSPSPDCLCFLFYSLENYKIIVDHRVYHFLFHIPPDQHRRSLYSKGNPLELDLRILSLYTASTRDRFATLSPMTMVMENQNRPYGGMSFDNVYHHTPPQFTDPWAAHTSSHSTPPVYATSMGNGASMGLSQVKQEEVNRTGMSMPYPNIPVSAPSMVAGSTYAAASYGPEVMGMQHEVPRTTFDQAPSYTTAPPMSSFAPSSYAYAPIHPSPQDARRISHS